MSDVSPEVDEAVAARRACLRLISYGLYAVTVRRGDEHSAFTANWLTQASFRPQLLALSVENDSHSIGILRETGVFTVNILPEGAVETAGALGKRWAKSPDKLDAVSWDEGPNGCAVLREALGHIDCVVESEVLAGDSTLFLARIVGAQLLREGAPLRMADTPYKHAG